MRAWWGASGVPSWTARAPGAGPAPAALSRGLMSLPNSGIAPGPRPGQAIWINFHCPGPPGHRDTEAEDLFTPKQRVQSGPRPGFPSILPSPSSGDLNANKAEALGAWRSPTDGRPLSAQFPSAGRVAGGGGGSGMRSPPQHTPSLPSVPYPRPRPDPAARSEALPALLLPGRGKRAAPGVEVCRGVRGPGGAPPTLAHPERRAADGSPAAAGRALQPGTGRRGSGAWLSRTARLPSGAGARPGAAAGKSDLITSASVQARPKLSVGGGGAGGSSGAWKRSRAWTGQYEGPPAP